ncbi:MAG: hypothetical protein HY741_16265 [Chloroflexi bacterium]|nr:hypothetical protein [Chloroflexota bacterium]
METIDHSPIVVIRRKEEELAARLEAARAVASDALVAASQTAAQYRDQVERAGQQAAAELYRAELAAVECEAQRIVQAGERAAAQIAAQGSRVLPQAVARILQIVLAWRD